MSIPSSSKRSTVGGECPANEAGLPNEGRVPPILVAVFALDEGSQGRPQAARRGSLDGPVSGPPAHWERKPARASWSPLPVRRRVERAPQLTVDRPAVRRRWRFYRTAGGSTPVRDCLTGATGARAAYRVLFATEGGRSQVLLAVSAFSKKTQRTPPGEIATAQRRLADWRARARKR